MRAARVDGGTRPIVFGPSVKSHTKRSRAERHYRCRFHLVLCKRLLQRSGEACGRHPDMDLARRKAEGAYLRNGFLGSGFRYADDNTKTRPGERSPGVSAKGRLAIPPPVKRSVSRIRMP